MGPTEHEAYLYSHISELEKVKFHIRLNDGQDLCAHVLPPYVPRYIHGQRAIYSEGEIDGLYRRSVTIADFSLAAVLFAKGMLDMPSPAPSSKGKPPGTLLLSSTIRTGDVPIFLDDVETHLPCVASILDLKQTNEFYMIYADGFVGANVRPRVGFAYENRPRSKYL
jgi:hypothetical protein